MKRLLIVYEFHPMPEGLGEEWYLREITKKVDREFWKKVVKLLEKERRKLVWKLSWEDEPAHRGTLRGE